MGQPSQHTEQVLSTLGDLIAGTKQDQLADATPCAKWTVRDLINHVCGGGHMFAMALRGEPAPDAHSGQIPDFVGDDPTAAFAATVNDFQSAASTPGALDKPLVLPFGTLPPDVAMNIAATDLLLHGWDLATATHQAFDPPADVISDADAFLRGFLQPQMRDGDTFAAEVQVGPAATPLQRFVAYSGRRP